MRITLDRYNLISGMNAMEIEATVEQLIERAPAFGGSVTASDVLTVDAQEMVKLVKYSVPQLSIFLMPSSERRIKFLEYYSKTIKAYPATQFVFQAEMASRYLQLLEVHLQTKYKYIRLLQENGLLSRSIDIQGQAVEIVHAEHEQIVKSDGQKIRDLYHYATEDLIELLTSSNSPLKPAGRTLHVIIYTIDNAEKNVVSYLTNQGVNHEIRDLSRKGQGYFLEVVAASGELSTLESRELEIPVMIVERKGRITVIKGRNISELETALGKGSLLRRIFG